MGLVSSIYSGSCKKLDDQERKLLKIYKAVGSLKKREAFGAYERAARRKREFSPEQQRELRNATSKIQRKDKVPYKTARVRAENAMRRQIAGPTRQERELEELADRLERSLASRKDDE